MYAEKPRLHERQKAHRAGDLRTIALDVTPRCNMRCPHCYAASLLHLGPIELEVLQGALDEAYDLGVFHYILQGGEPILEPGRLEAILRACHPDETYLNVVTNGWSMSGETVRWLRELKVDKITFSLDSGIECEHDANRMPGSFRRVLAAIECVQAEGLLAGVSTVVSHETLYGKGFRKAYGIARRRGIRLDVQIAEPVGRWDGQTVHLITPEDARYIKALQLGCPVLANGQKMVSRDIYSGERDHCPAGTEFMGLTADGQLLPCNFLQFTLGTIRDRSIREMRDALLTSGWFDGRHPGCLCGEDRAFIDCFIKPHVDEPKPLDAWRIFDLPRPQLS